MRLLKVLPWMLLVWTPAVALADSIVTSWQESDLNQRLCTNRAIQVMQEAGFSNIAVIGAAADADQSVVGKHEEYSSAIRCISKLKVVFFVTVGPSAKGAGVLQQYLKQRFGGDRPSGPQATSDLLSPVPEILR